MKKIKVYTLFLCSFILSVICAAGAVAMVRAFTVNDDLAAVESIFGTMVIILCLAILAGKSYKAGKSLSVDKG